MTDAEDSASRGHIITFYSYQGGCGRTMALANLAWILASNGYRVLVVDWDLESSGLHHFFHPFLRDPHLRASDGVIDLMQRYADTTVQADEPDPEWFTRITQIRDIAYSLDWQFPDGGGIDLVPAGRQDSAYSMIVSNFDWATFWDRLHGGALIEALRRDMHRHYDYTLIDSRNGLSDTAGIATVKLPDIVVNCFTTSMQSINGAAGMAQFIQAEHERDRKSRHGASRDPVRIYPVPMRVEDGEKHKLDRARAHARRMFGRFVAELGLPDMDGYWGAVEVPYRRYYAYEETLAVFGDQPGYEGSLLAAYERLTTILVGTSCRLPPIPDGARRRVLAQFERTAAATPASVLISYAPRDRIWAEWLTEELAAAGHHSFMRRVGEPLGEPAEVDRVLVMVSREFAQTGEAERLVQWAAQRPEGGRDDLVLPVRIGRVALPSALASFRHLDLVRARPERASELLRSTLGPGDCGPGLDGLDETRGRQIRYPPTRASHWRLPYTRNPAFTGRDAVLDSVWEQLTAQGDAAARHVLVGLSGIGKTQIALEYAYRYAAAYDLVWWVPADPPALARAALADLGAALRIAVGSSVDERVDAVREALHRGEPTTRWLLVVDNADDDGIIDLLPDGPGQILVTTRNPDWKRHADVTEVDVFDRGESVALLTRTASGISEADAQNLAERLGDLPFAIEQAGAWLASTAMPVPTYLGILDNDAAKALGELLPPEYPQSSTATWRVSIERLRSQRPAAARLLELCSFLAPQPIPTQLLTNQRLVEVLTSYDPALADPMLHAGLFRDIARFALARVDSARHAIVVHRLTQSVVRTGLTDHEQRETRARVQEMLAAAAPKDAMEPSNWPTFAELHPHIEPSGALESGSDEVRQMVLEMVRYLRLRSDSRSSQELAEQTLAAWQPAYGEDDSLTLMLRFQLANALRAIGEHQRAHDIDQDVLARLSLIRGEGHPYTLMAAGSLAADLRARGDFDQAREHDLRTLSGFRDAFGDDHLRTLMAANNLAVSLRLVGDFAAAAQRDLDTLHRKRRTLGPTHPSTLLSASNHGRDLRELGNLAQSREILDATLHDCRGVLGPDHPDSLRTGKSLAVTLRRLGELEAASSLIAETLLGYQAMHLPRHPESLACDLEHACVLAALGGLDEARHITDDVHRSFREQLGDRHPLTLAAANNLAVLHGRCGDLDAARDLATHTAHRLQATLGAHHPYTLVAQHNLATALHHDARPAQGRRHDKESYRELRARYSDDHPTVVVVAANLAASRLVDDTTLDAEGLMAEAADRCAAILGEQHPDTQAAYRGERIGLDLEPLPT